MTAKPGYPALEITHYSLPFQVPGSQRDRKLLHYFCVQGSQELAGFLNLDFWTRTVFAQSHHEATVRQALVALSSLHLDCTTVLKAREETLAQYGKALRMLQRRMRTPGDEASRAALICSILFHCFEATLGNTQAATYHLQGGLRLLASWRAEGTTKGLVDEMDAVALEFERLDLQTMLFYDQRVPILGNLFYQEDAYVIPRIQAFQRLTDAHRSLLGFIYCGWLLICDNLNHKFDSADGVPASILETKRSLQEGLQQWKTSFDALKTRVSDSEGAGYGFQILLVHWHVASMLLDAVFPANSDVWGASPNPQAAHLLSLVESVIGSSGPAAGSTPSTSVPAPSHDIVSSEMGVVAPLFALALKCADPKVSGGAFHLLSSTRRKEGLWDSGHMAGLLAKLRSTRRHKYKGLEEERLREAKRMSLEELWREELCGEDSGRDGSFQAKDMVSTYFEHVVTALYGSSQAEA